MRRIEGVFCPDCGRESRPDERICPMCGYPLSDLQKRLRQEEEDSLGWAERIIGKPKIDLQPPKEPPLTSFATGPEPPKLEQEKDEDKGRRCDNCSAKVEIGTLCQNCGDKLPSLFDNDPYLFLVIKDLWRIVVAPRQFATHFPYPVKGGILQPLLYPGVFAGFFVLSLPFSRAISWFGDGDPTMPLLTAFVGILLALIIMPGVVYLSSGLIHLVARILGGRISLRRTIRVVGACMIGLFILGVITNLLRFASFYFGNQVEGALASSDAVFRETIDFFANRRELTLAIELGIGAWLFSWVFGGLYRLSWWKSIILMIAAYWVLMLSWVYLLIILPLYTGGLL